MFTILNANRQLLWKCKNECSTSFNLKSNVCSQIISIEGNIGSGKSTLIDNLNTIENIVIHKEPIDQWTPWLDLFYKDMPKRILGFQFKILISYYKLLLKIKNTETLLIERTPYTSFNIFLKDNKLLDEYEHSLLREYFDELLNNL